jgi:hypothetical protein
MISDRLDICSFLGERSAKPASLRASHRKLYSDSRALEISSHAMLRDFYSKGEPSLSDNGPDSGGFTVVRSGYKPTSTRFEESIGLSDFYKFQLKDRKIKEWTNEISSRLSAAKCVESLAKRRRFAL